MKRGRLRRSPLQAVWASAVLTLTLVACSTAESAPPQVRSYLEGTVTVRPEVDSTQNYSGFELVVAHAESPDADVDTLGYAETDSTGRFAMPITAPRRGIYTLLVSRYGTLLKADEIAIAEGDSATMSLRLPAGNRPTAIRSPENAAWLAYRNVTQQHTQALMEVVQSGAYSEAEVERNVMQTAAVLWNLRETFPGTIGASLAAAEAITQLGAWNDSLVVAYTRQVEPDNPRLVDIVRTGRKAVARLAGQDSALAFVRGFQADADDLEIQAGLQSEIVIAYMDSSQNDQALAAVRNLQSAYANTSWSAWAERARYELETLMPGQMAPTFTATTYDGEPFDLAGLRGRHVLLEFYRPEQAALQQELPLRAGLYEIAEPGTFDIVSISLQPDTVVTEAFYEGRAFPGIHIIAPSVEGYQPVEQYAVGAVPTRILIDPDGRIVNKYVGNAMIGVRDEVLAALGITDPNAE